MRLLHPRAFTVSVVWTLGLLYLGSVVHATESSLACPDWPTCFGTMVPEMTGGVFWEHLHRLVAGGLLLMWGLATWLTWKESRHRRWMVRGTVAGITLLLVQSVFGGLTVIYQLPDLVSTTHLSLALIFLGLATALATASGWAGRMGEIDGGTAAGLRRYAAPAAFLVFVQSVIGGLVRHTDAGMACPDVPLCLGEWVPPLESSLVALHFSHRVIGILAAAAVVGLAVWAVRRNASPALRSLTFWAGALVLLQVTLGFVSVLAGLAVVPVSLHSLIAALILVILVHLAVTGWVRASPAERVAEHDLHAAPAS